MSLTNEERLEAAKTKATRLGIKFNPTIGLEKLEAKIKAHLEAAEETKKEVAKDTQPDLPEHVKKFLKMAGAKSVTSKQSARESKMKAAQKLTRIILNCNDPNKRDWAGELISAGNTQVGFVKKYIPFGVEWHVPEILLRTLKEKKCQIFTKRVNATGATVNVPKLIPAYTINVLEDLTPQELENLAREQQGTGRLEGDD